MFFLGAVSEQAHQYVHTRSMYNRTDQRIHSVSWSHMQHARLRLDAMHSQSRNTFTAFVFAPGLTADCASGLHFP